MNKKRPLISLIAAIDKHNLIGDSGKIPWIIPGELKRFKEVTMGKPIVMGRKTHELNPNHERKRIVFSRQFKQIQLIEKNIPNQPYSIRNYGSQKCYRI